MAGYNAHAISSNQNGASRELSSIFPKGLTKVFSCVFTARFTAGGTGGTAITISDQGGVFAGFSISVSLYFQTFFFRKNLKFFEILLDVFNCHFPTFKIFIYLLANFNFW